MWRGCSGSDLDFCINNIEDKMKEYLDLEILISFLKDSNQPDELKKIENFKIEVEEAGFKISDFEYQYDNKDSSNGIVPKHKFLPKYDEMPFDGDKKIKGLQNKISSNMEIKTQLDQIKNGLSSMQIVGLSDDAKEIILSGCFNMYFSFLQEANGFSRLEFKEMKKYGVSRKEADIELIEKIFVHSRDIRNRHFSHKDMSINSHILSFYSDSRKNGVSIQTEEKHIAYLHKDDIFIKDFMLLVNFTCNYINLCLKENVSKLEKILNNDYLSQLNEIEGLSLPDYRDEVSRKQKAKGLKRRDEI